jgi:hypothetical protein
MQESDLEISLQYGIFWVNLKGMEPTDNKENITVIIPYKNRFNRAVLEKMMSQVNENGELSK